MSVEWLKDSLPMYPEVFPNISVDELNCWFPIYPEVFPNMSVENELWASDPLLEIAKLIKNTNWNKYFIFDLLQLLIPAVRLKAATLAKNYPGGTTANNLHWRIICSQTKARWGPFKNQFNIKHCFFRCFHWICQWLKMQEDTPCASGFGDASAILWALITHQSTDGYSALWQRPAGPIHPPGSRSKLSQHRQRSGRFFQHGKYALLRQIGELALRLEFWKSIVGHT